MKILITGVYGIVGSYLCNKLKNNHEIVGLGRKENYDGCQKYYSCDITNQQELETIIKENLDIDVIIHCAALAHNKGNDLSKDRFMKVNYEATTYLTDLSNTYLKLKNFIFISTISVYGEEFNKFIYKEEDECHPKSPYAVAKKKSEDYIIANCKSNYTMFRLAPVYSKDFKLNIERRTLIKGIPYKVGKGQQRLSLCNINNVYRAIDYVINNYEQETKEIYNVSDREIYEFNDLLDFNNKKIKISFPKLIFMGLYHINKISFKKQFLHENSIKLITDNIYSSDKLEQKVNMKNNIRDVI